MSTLSVLPLPYTKLRYVPSNVTDLKAPSEGHMGAFNREGPWCYPGSAALNWRIVRGRKNIVLMPHIKPGW
jgi:hypothetical protein